MKKIIVSLGLIVISMQLMMLNVFAVSDTYKKPKPVTIKSNLLEKTIQKSKALEQATARGDFFIGADIVISNEGNGNIGGLAIAYLDVGVEEVYISVYLDQYDEKADIWRQVAYYDAEYYAEDYPDGLNSPSLNVTFKNQKKGHYYRLRGAFSAVKDNKFEGFSPVTDGIWIE